MTTGATRANRTQAAPYLRSPAAIPAVLDQLLHDPQTSGGLLLAVPQTAVPALVRRLEDAGHVAAIVGEVVAGEPGLELAGSFERFVG